MQKPPPSETDFWTILDLLKWTTIYFKEAGIDSPRSTAEILLAHVLGVERIALYMRYDQPVTVGERQRFKTLIRRRQQGEPVAYITGDKEFWGLSLSVTPDVLIPRPETECLVEAALKAIPDPADGRRVRVLELGTGSGAIALALATERPEPLLVASDLSPRALAVADRNARRLHLKQSVRFVCGDLDLPFRPDGGRFDVIVSNPPYIRSGDIGGLQREIREHEPVEALDGGADGLRCIHRIVEHAAGRLLAPGGRLLMEIGFDQRKAVEEMARNTRLFDTVSCLSDYSGLDRVMDLSRRRS